MYMYCSLVPRPPPRFYLAAMEKNQFSPRLGDKIWAEAWERGYIYCLNDLASFPVPRPAFRRLQYGKAGRAWYIFSREHDVIRTKTLRLHVIQPSTRSTLGEYDSRPPLARYVWCVTWYLRSSCCSETHYANIKLPVFLPLSTLDVTHVRKCTRPSPLYRTASDGKLGVGLGTRL